ncbi:hypothetical protein [Staphylococcus arlettae]|uniref:hypothetical protein n=1 Tax=Staphylococcus arlettae TaxID=29378 RepID=UPI0021D283E1|nr:hypothetical protein [Staphylococcus arlettae]UXU53173.1 hypothetical protein MUA71_03600 [Staphylococcus arlettae]
MQEIQEKGFDYSIVDNETAEKLKTYDERLNRIYNNYSVEVGEVLYKAQQELANHDKGTFQNWVRYKGFKVQSAYNYINVYKVIQNLDNLEDRDTFISQPKSLQYEMSKPSANQEANQAVFNGDIKTHKEYKELERQLKQRDEEKSQLESQLEQAKRSESIVQKQLEDEQDKEPEVVEHYMEPEDYQELKERSAELEKNNKELKSKLKSLETTPKVENQTFTDYRDEINAHTDAVEPEVKKAMQHETSAKAYMAAIDEIITITDDEVTDFELFERYIATMDYKLIGKAKDKIETLMKLGGYK